MMMKHIIMFMIIIKTSLKSWKKIEICSVGHGEKILIVVVMVFRIVVEIVVGIVVRILV